MMIMIIVVIISRYMIISQEKSMKYASVKRKKVRVFGYTFIHIFSKEKVDMFAIFRFHIAQTWFLQASCLYKWFFSVEKYWKLDKSCYLHEKMAKKANFWKGNQNPTNIAHMHR